MSALFAGKSLVAKKDGQIVTVSADEVAARLNGRVVVIYFSAHWCPPCRGFTPVLKEFYEEIGSDKLEVVFVSFDRSDSEFDAYVKNDHGEWLVVSFSNPVGKELAGKYGVSGIPFAAVIGKDGTVVASDVRGALQRKEKSFQEIFKEWKAASGL